ncbi:MAG: AAA family ATPase [Catenibacterium mitsuokai]|nr:AAA family ATPase [Catenibacterium mitsuokai]MDY3676947.1 AAA family ATPase [Catenibacterium mitsuokai]
MTINRDDNITGVKSTESAKEQLFNMIGMQSVKDVLEAYDVRDKQSTSNYTDLTASRLNPNLPKTEKKAEMIHFVLTGNPGTGKTTVAKLIGQMFYEMGYLESGHVVEVNRSQLIGEYIGQTAIKTAGYIQRAMGGVLFIDEAYTLKRSDDNDHDFGQEAIDTLLKAMDQYKGKFIVVAVGYPKEMDTFINSNPGLQRRLTEKIHIEDYTAEEMYEILLLHAKKNSVKFSDELLQKLPNFCENWVNSADEKWGNAREAVVLINHMIRNWKKDADAKSIVEDGQTIGILEEKHIPESLLDNL